MNSGSLFILFLIITSISLLATVFGIRYLKNKENVSLIEKGINPNADRPQKARPKPFASLRIGLPLLGAGLGLLIASIIDFNAGRGHDEIVGIYFGLIIALAGLGFYQSYRIEMKWWSKDEERKD